MARLGAVAAAAMDEADDARRRGARDASPAPAARARSATATSGGGAHKGTTRLLSVALCAFAAWQAACGGLPGIAPPAFAAGACADLDGALATARAHALFVPACVAAAACIVLGVMAMAEGQNSGGAKLHSHPGTCATRVFPKDFILPRQVNMAVAFQRWHLGNAQKKIHPFKRAAAQDCYVPKKPANDASGEAKKKYTEAKSSRVRLTKWKGVMDGYMSLIKDDPAVYVANPKTPAQVTKMYKAASKKAADKVKAARAAKLAAANAALPAGAKPKKSRKRPIEARSPVTMYEYFIEAGIIQKKKKRTE